MSTDNRPWGKLYEKTFEGSMYGAGPVVFAVWCYAIAHMKPPTGQAKLNPRSLADTIGCTVQEVEAALEFLCAPDPRSDSPAMEGKRLLKVSPFMYEGVNFAQYRSGRQPEERREQVREAVAKHRAKAVIQDVSRGNPRKAQAEAEAEAEAEKEIQAAPSALADQGRPTIPPSQGLPTVVKARPKGSSATASRPSDVDERVWQDWLVLRRTKKAPVTETVLAGFVREAEKAKVSLTEALRIACQRGWTGFKAEWLAGDKAKAGGAWDY